MNYTKQRLGVGAFAHRPGHQLLLMETLVFRGEL